MDSETAEFEKEMIRVLLEAKEIEPTNIQVEVYIIKIHPYIKVRGFVSVPYNSTNHWTVMAYFNSEASYRSREGL